jgi:hypothetical protein
MSGGKASGDTAAKVEAILKANIVNLGRKVLEGKTLSAFEIDLLRQEAGEPPIAAEYVSNQVELAAALGCNRKTIQRWLKEPGHPETAADGRYNVTAWRQWMADRGKRAGVADGDDPLDVNRLRARNILLQNEKLEFQLRVLRKEYIPRDLVQKWGGDLGAAIRKVVTQLHLAAPNLAGLSIPEIEARMKEMEDEVLSQLHALDDAVTEWDEQVAKEQLTDMDNEPAA